MESNPTEVSAPIDGVKLVRYAGARTDHAGSLHVSDGSIRFESANPGTLPVVWPVPRLDAEAPKPGVLWVQDVLKSALLHLGHPDDTDLVSLPADKVQATKEALQKVGVSPEDQLYGRAVFEMRGRRRSGPFFLFLGVLDLTTGAPTFNGVALGLAGLSAIVAGTRPVTMLLFAIGFLALALRHLVTGGFGLWSVLFLWFSFSDLRSWRLIHPLSRDPRRWRWVGHQVLNSRQIDVVGPPGYLARSFAFLVGGAFACGGIVIFATIYLAGSLDPFLIGGDILFIALAAWYFLVAADPGRSQRLAAGVLPSLGPVALTLYPLLLSLMVLGALAATQPEPAGSDVRHSSTSESRGIPNSSSLR